MRGMLQKRWVGNLLVCVASCLFALVVGEMALQAFYPPPRMYPKVYDVVGVQMKPGTSGIYTKEGFSHYSVNSVGFRDAEYSVEKPAGVFRIVVLGDSFAEGLCVELEDTFHKVLERRLGDGVEVLCFALRGYGTAHELLVYEHYARQFSPDLVVLAFYPGNDIDGNYAMMTPSARQPYYVVATESGYGVEFQRSPKFEKARWLLPAYYYLVDRFAIPGLVDQYRRYGGRRPETGLRPDGLSRGVYAEPTTERMRTAWDLTERLLLKLDGTVRADGCGLVMMLVTCPIQLNNDCDDPCYPNRRLKAFAQKHGIGCLDLLPAFSEHWRRTKEPLHGTRENPTGHWNKRGHRLAGELLASFLTVD